MQHMVSIAPIVNIDRQFSNGIGRGPSLMGEGLTSSRFGPTMGWRSTGVLDDIINYIILYHIIIDYSISCACAGLVLLLELRLREGMLILSRDSWHVAMQLVMQLVAQCLGAFRQIWQTHLPLPPLPS